jgi:hypothetical protein
MIKLASEISFWSQNFFIFYVEKGQLCQFSSRFVLNCLVSTGSTCLAVFLSKYAFVYGKRFLIFLLPYCWLDCIEYGWSVILPFFLFVHFVDLLLLF